VLLPRLLRCGAQLPCLCPKPASCWRELTMALLWRPVLTCLQRVQAVHDGAELSEDEVLMPWSAAQFFW